MEPLVETVAPIPQEEAPMLWIYPKEDPELKDKIIQEFHLHPVLAQLLVSRGITTLEDIHYYLYAKLPDLHDPFLFAEMPQAVKRIAEAILSEENILIYGDNDVDGMTGTALLAEFFNFIGAKVFHYVSNRTTLLRQSMILDALEYALKTHCTLLITVDCGITAAEQIEQVVRHKVDVIITDHHEPTDKIPLCVATLNPKLVNTAYPNRELTGVGVAFKLACALTEYLVDEGVIPAKKVDLKRYLDLVAIGTVSDMGLLRGENRVLVSYGLEQLRKTKRIGIAKLLAICEIDLSDITTSVIASKIAPRLNSLGRIAEPEHGVKLLLARQALAAEKLAIELNLYNIERQKIERMMAKDIERIIETSPSVTENKAIVLTSRKWHPGIIAILAMRISKQYNRPAVMIALDGQVGKGSIRSIPEFPVLPVLKELSELLLNFGGHDTAAGLTIREQCIDEFTKRFIAIANDRLQDLHVTPKLHLDALVHFDDLTFDLMESIKLLEPHGHGNPSPLLYADAVQVAEPKVIGKHHLRLTLEGEGRRLECIAIGLAPRIHELQAKPLSLRIAFTPQVSGSSIQLVIRDFQVRPSA
ncbi:MAG: single-stranded-DNA-specific exonuclease RecJ [Verrucomicrobia bacterium]|nr:single-stranded-DNA-specific exonuclease RecJ [Verrucomicrobiota bacterium]